MDRKVQEPVKLFQYNTLGALMAGLYGGTMTVGELLEHGDLGLGTLDSIDGELIVLDGKAYQAKGSGQTPEIVEVAADALNSLCSSGSSSGRSDFPSALWDDW